MEESKMVLRTEDLVKKYGKRTVVSHVSINVKQGEIVGLLGPNGAGKTTLVKALTGVDTDRLAEEKARGITIELGYAYLPLADGEVLGFIDVPGHERLVHTMAAGASGIDFALLVVAADDGVMPQTREHLAILGWLGVTRGAVAITKADRVDSSRLTQVRDEIAALTAGTFLEGAPVFAVRAQEPGDEGTAALRAHLEQLRRIDSAALLGHIHAHEAKAVHWAWLHHCLYKTPYILTRRVPQTIKNTRFNQYCYEHAQYAVAISSPIETHLHSKQWCPVARIPSALAHLKNNPDQVKALKEQYAHNFVVGHIGALVDKHKGQREIIKAAKLLENEIPEAIFLILGDGPDKEALLAESQGLSNIKWLGFKSNIGDYLAIMDLFVFPSRNEGLGSTLLDVMDYQIPIIASNVDGIPDIVIHEKTGILIPPNDAQALASAIACAVASFSTSSPALAFPPNAPSAAAIGSPTIPVPGTVTPRPFFIRFGETQASTRSTGPSSSAAATAAASASEIGSVHPSAGFTSS